MRRLLVTHRTVPPDRGDEYARSWLALLAAAREIGAHAWLFRPAGRADEFVEFVESADRSPLQHETLAAALLALDEVAAGTGEDLEEGIL